jgi:pilus assembly protein CpaE
MPDDGNHMFLRATADAAADPAASRPNRPPLVAFVADAQSEEALEDGLTELVPGKFDVRRGGVRAAIVAMQKEPTPRVLVVDVSGEEQPLTALADLAHVVEPDVCVLVIGEFDGVDFYREITRGLGAADYLAKPLTRDKVARHFGMLVRGQAAAPEAMLGGRAVSITGVRGGVGTTTIAANLAWHFGVTLRRHTVLLDPDLHLGAAAFMLNAPTGNGLRMALEAPERIDTLLAERAAQPVSERLHVLAGEEKAAVMPSYADGAAGALLEALRNRFNFIVAEAPFVPLTLYRDLLDQVHQRVLVMEPTLAAVRDALRLLALPNGPRQNQRAVLVLNRVGIPGGLNRRQVEDALTMKVDVAIPDLPRQMNHAAILGEPAIASSSSFRSGMLELARQVAFLGLLDSSTGAASDAAGGGRRDRWRLFGGRR